MTPPEEERVLVFAPRGRDGVLAARLLQKHGFLAHECRSAEEVIAGLDTAGCALLSSETLVELRDQLAAKLAVQPPWSDFPIVVFAPAGGSADEALEATRLLGNVTILERPVHIRTLISAVVAALRARRRQYEGRDAIRARDQFLAMLGHELRNPLAAIMLALEMLHGVSGDVGQKQRTIIDRQVRHLGRLVDDLLDVARVTSGKISLKNEAVDINDVARRCIQGAELAAHSRKIELRVATTAEPLLVYGDLVRLEEVFTNLIGNAIKYSPEHALVQLATRREGDQCVVDVVDTGVGIAPDVLAKVFELFAQADASLHRSQGGLGIGLTLVRSLVELHHGTVDAYSEGLGQGSRFTVRLPLIGTAQRSSTPQLAIVPDERPQLRVILVEDNIDLLEMTKDLLELQGCSVISASDGSSGLARILTVPCDIAFVDIGLPGVDGFEIAKQIRAHAIAQPYLVAMTGYGQPEDRQRALAAGFDDHLTKPVSVDVIQRVLVQCARRERAAEREQLSG